MSEPCVGCGIEVKYHLGQTHARVLDMMRQLWPMRIIDDFRTWCGTCWRAR